MVFSTRTEVRKLTELDVSERRQLVAEIKAWDEDVALRKGRELWQRAVLGYCEGKRVWKDDETVVDAGDMTRVGD